MSEIFRQDINIDGILLGLQENEMEKCVPVHAMSAGFIIKQMLTPSWAGRRISQSTGEIIKMMTFYAKTMKEFEDAKNTVETDDIKTLDGFPALASSALWRKAEFSSANFQANARGCAKLASIMSLKGTVYNVYIRTVSSELHLLIEWCIYFLPAGLIWCRNQVYCTYCSAQMTHKLV